MSLSLVVDSAAVLQKAATFPEQARALAITSPERYTAACDFLQTIKALRAEIAETFDPHIKRAYDAHRALCAEKKDAEAPLVDAERIAKAAMVTYEQAQERLRREEAARLQAELRKVEEERRLTEAVAAEASGDTEVAEQLLAEPVFVPTVAVAPTTPKVAGISYRETWSGKLTDIAALIRYAAANPQFMGLLEVNQPALNQLARSMKAQMQIPGVEAVCTRDVAAGRR